MYLRNKTWTDKTLSESERRLLKSAIKKRTKEHHRLVLERDRLTMRTSETLSSIDRYILHKSIDHNVKNGEKEFIKTHEKKLKNLTKNSILKRSIQLSDLLLIRSSPARPESSRYHRTEKLLVTSTLIDRLEHNRNCAFSNGRDKRERTKRNTCECKKGAT